MTADPDLRPETVLLRATGHSLGGVLAPRSRKKLTSNGFLMGFYWCSMVIFNGFLDLFSGF